MARAATCNSGIPAVGRIPWGSHFCNFYQTTDDLAACLLPFFRQALADDEMGIWITSEPLGAREARRRLGALEPTLPAREASGQIQIVDFADWYTESNGSITARALQNCIDRLAAAEKRGFGGVRMSGNSFWLERKYWTLFSDYERKLHQAMRNSRIVVLCSYSLERCTGRDVVEVAGHHDFALSHGPQGCQRMEKQ